ncbi:MAG: Leucyl-tRNA synthetase, partial [uncultured Thermoleophilia bacterium]
GAIRPRRGRAAPAGRVGRRARVRDAAGRRGVRRPAEELRARDAPVPLGRAPHGARHELHHGRRRLPLPPPERVPGAAPDGLRRVRAERRERRHPHRRAPGRGDAPEHRHDPLPDAPHGLVDRLEPRARDVRPALLPLDAVDLPAAAGTRPRLQARGARELVPAGPDGAGQRAGHRRSLRALRLRGREAQPVAVVLPDHGLRGPPAGRHGDPRELARAGSDHAAELDRPL